MTTKTWIIVSAFVVGYLIYGFITLDRRSDAEKISSAIYSAAKAVNDRDLSNSLAFISPKYKDNEGWNKDKLRLLAAQVYRSDASYMMTAEITDIRIDGDNAAVVVHLAILSNENMDKPYDKNLTLTMEKERAYHMYAIPTSIWRVTSLNGHGFGDYGYF